MMTAFWIVFTLAISTLNAIGAGYAWTTSKESGGFARLVVWSVAGMAAIGYTMVFSIAGLAMALAGHYITPELAARGDALVFSLIAIPILGCGLVITIDSWAAYHRSRSLLDLASAGYNTWAMWHNASVIASNLGGTTRSAKGLFSDLELELDSIPIFIVLAIVALSFGSGILLTWAFYRIGRRWADDHMLSSVREARQAEKAAESLPNNWR
jgi:hypothetical protein